jgi:hypothetical protein
VIPDILGSIVAMTDRDGNLVGRHAYDPFGAEQGTPALNSPSASPADGQDHASDRPTSANAAASPGRGNFFLP